MDDIHLFAWMDAALSGPMDASLAALIARVQAWVVPLLGGVLSMLIMGVGYAYYRAPKSDFLENLGKVIGSFIIAAGTIYAPNYETFIVSLFLHAMPDSLSLAVAGGFGSTGPSGAAAFDQSVNLNWASGARLWDGVGAMPGKSWLLGLVAIASWAWTFLTAGLGWVMYQTVRLILRILLVLGPVFLLFFPWETTGGWTKGWLNACATCVLTQVAIVTVVAFLVGVQAAFADQIMAILSNNTDFMAKITKLLFAQGVCSFLLAFVIYRICGISANIMHSHVAHAVDGMGSRTANAALGVANRGVDAARTAAGYTAAAGKAANANVRASGINATTSGTTPAGHAARMRQQAANNPTGPMVGASYPWRT